MNKLKNLKPERVFKFFEEITQIPRGSGDMERISSYCMDFAEKNFLKAVRDDANNVIIFKPASKGYEGSEPVILQGHLDMVCQKEPDVNIDFERDGLDIYVDGDFIKARGTTLGADNGIAVAMILAILESDDISHPPIEAVFTTDEEMGMIGAGKLKSGVLKGKKLINIDSEEQDSLTVSCAGGSDFRMIIPVNRVNTNATRVSISITGLKGGHSGVEINSGRINANILAGRLIDYAKSVSEFDIISINGGTKGNAIPSSCEIELAVYDTDKFTTAITEYIVDLKKEYQDRDDGEFDIEVKACGEGTFEVLEKELRDKLIFMLLIAPNGVQEMSDKINGLVETSLNLGILKTERDKITMLFTLRSNKKTALEFLEKKLETFSSIVECTVETSGHYPPWEFNSSSELQKLYKNVFKEISGYEPSVEAIHAGLECGIFSSLIPDLDAISIGPLMYDIHTTEERLSISSVKMMYEVILKVLGNCK